MGKTLVERRPVDDASLIRRMPLFASLSDDEVESLARVTRRETFEAGQVIFHQGMPGDTSYVILSGEVKVSVVSRNGQEAVLALLQDGESFGELALLDEEPRSATIRAVQRTVVLRLRKSDLHRLMRRQPGIVVELLRVMARRLRATDQIIEDAAFLTVGRRLAKKLLELAASHGQAGAAGTLIDRHLTQQELAAMIGATRESVNKEFNRLRRHGILAPAPGRRIIIHRPDTLAGWIVPE